MPTLSNDLWSLTDGRPHIDPSELADAIQRELEQRPLDFRTRLLIRDGLDALGNFWGTRRLEAWLDQSCSAIELREILRGDLGPPGFPSLPQRIMEATKPETVFQFLRELGVRIVSAQRIEIGGAISLILSGHLSRHTEDIDIVDQVPTAIGSQHELLNKLSARYGLHLSHFQSHFLPGGWRQRVRSLGRLGNLDVFLVDPADVFVGKVFSNRTKDLDDLRILARQLDQSEMKRRLLTSATALLANTALAENAVRNWYILYGENLEATGP